MGKMAFSLEEALCESTGFFTQKGDAIVELKGKKAIVLGERDGIQGPAIAECLKSAGAEPLLVQTQCFV